LTGVDKPTTRTAGSIFTTELPDIANNAIVPTIAKMINPAMAFTIF